MFMLALALIPAAAQDNSYRNDTVLVSSDGVGPIQVSTDLEVNGKTAELHASARNESGKLIAYARFCIQAKGQAKGCDFELWTTAPWKPGEELRWPALKGHYRGVQDFSVAIKEFRAAPDNETPAKSRSRSGSTDRAPESDRFTVFLSAPLRNGFVDTNRDIQDSINDIRILLSHMKDMAVVDSTDKADMILIVVSRGGGSEKYGERLSYTEYFGHAELDSVEIVKNTIWVSTVMFVGDYSKEFTGYDSSVSGITMELWRTCAELIAKSLQAWAEANMTQLREHRVKQKKMNRALD